MSNVLTSSDLAAALARLPEWRHEGDALRRDFRFADFVEAFAFLSAVALMAEKHGHHPEITNVYRDVGLVLRSHDADNRVTQRDVALAQAIDAHLVRSR